MHSSKRIGKEQFAGRKNFFLWQMFNSFSSNFLGGNILTLYILKFNVGNLFIGVVSSLTYVSLLMLFVGRLLVTRLGFVKLMGLLWIIRYVISLLILLSPYFALKGYSYLSLAVFIFVIVLTSIARGIDSVSYTPILGELAVEP
ncbi:MAG: hypothetical protein AB1798_04385, partial [Spirochaetota bacterium]